MYAEGSGLGKSEQCSKRKMAKIGAAYANFRILRFASRTPRRLDRHSNYMNI
jgi:hypothetical protein